MTGKDKGGSQNASHTVYRYQFQLRISADQYLDYYRGTVKHVVVQAGSGQTVQFPANLLQKFVTPDGIHGSFVLTCDQNHKVVELQRISP